MTLTISPQTAHRTAVLAQKLAGPRPAPTKESMQAVLRAIRCLQLDPIRAVERTQYTVLWSRLGHYNRDHLHELIYQDKWLFEYWAHAASIVLTEDYPLHEIMMRNYGKAGSAWSRRVTQWVADNPEFKSYILAEIDRLGPRLTGEFEDQSKVPWQSGGWSSGRSVGYMLDYLWTSGQIMVSQRDGLKRWWDLSERVLPSSAPAGGLTAEEVTYTAAQHSLKALGIGRARDIKRHFIEKRYVKLPDTLAQLESEGKIKRVTITDDVWGTEPWYIHSENESLLETAVSDWQPRTTLLSPFDGLIRDRDRTELMWGFYYRIEIYVPKAKRQYGYYVLPILHGDKLIGRIDPHMDRKKNILTVNAVYLEEQTKADAKTGRAVAQAIRELARFLEAKQVVYGENVPQKWRKSLKNEDLD